MKKNLVLGKKRMQSKCAINVRKQLMYAFLLKIFIHKHIKQLN